MRTFLNKMHSMDATQAKPTTTPPVNTAIARVTLSRAELLGRDKAIVIEHRGERFEPRFTRNGKLILAQSAGTKKQSASQRGFPPR